MCDIKAYEFAYMTDCFK